MVFERRQVGDRSCAADADAVAVTDDYAVADTNSSNAAGVADDDDAA